MRLLIAGGGTAGHINPGIAIAEELLTTHPESRILFVGREGGRENELIKKAGIDLRTIKINGLRRSLSLENAKRLILAIRSINEAKEIIKDFTPDVILGMGGYVCWPIITAGKRLNIPTAIHESNVSPGLTTKLLSRKCDVVFLSKEETKKYLSKRIRMLTVGTPVRAEFKKYDRNYARKRLGINNNDFLRVSFGGSLGSEKLNETILKVIENYSSKDKNIKHIHGVGRRYFEAKKTKEYDGCKIVPFINDMPFVMKAADLVICRSGSMTISEICEVGIASILIPSPNVTANHQFLNAKLMEDRGAGILIEEKNMNEKELILAINRFKNDEFDRKTRAKNSKTLSTPNSAKKIIKELFTLKNQ